MWITVTKHSLYPLHDLKLDKDTIHSVVIFHDKYVLFLKDSPNTSSGANESRAQANVFILCAMLTKIISFFFFIRDELFLVSLGRNLTRI